jgi:hypothetical protein
MAHAFDEKNVRDSVKLVLPKEYKVKVFQVRSGDSGQNYWIQRIIGPKTDIILCDCPVGKFNQPAEILGLGNHLRCKHILNLMELS